MSSVVLDFDDGGMYQLFGLLARSEGDSLDFDPDDFGLGDD
ncbi:MAG TPA: hypothetical protein PKC73_00410 [Dermatophilaceae bacterium]|jgi:hypothetical protein|nr:hypothetical protein [Dermatophilaceae bacterium]